MVSWPTYDNQKFSRIIPYDYYNSVTTDPAKPLLNQGIAGQHAVVGVLLRFRWIVR